MNKTEVVVQKKKTKTTKGAITKYYWSGMPGDYAQLHVMLRITVKKN